MCYFVNIARAEWTWEGLLAKCKQIHKTYASDIEIPASYKPDVLKVFDYTEVQHNVFQFVMCILAELRRPEGQPSGAEGD